MKTALTEQFRRRIREKIEEIEAKTCLEIVPVLAHASSDYQGIRSSLTLGTGFITYATLTFAYFSQPIYCLSISLGIAGLVALLLIFPSILRLVIPRKLLLLEVEEGAHLTFLREEVFNTRYRTGILIYISAMEKAVYILADRALSEKVASDIWVTLGAKLAKDFQKKSPGDTFLEALDSLANELSADFPPLEGSEKNELPDEVRLIDEKLH